MRSSLLMFAGFLLLGILLGSCEAPVDRVLLRQDGLWEVQRAVYENYLDETFISSRDESQEGILNFLGAGTGQWIFPDSILQDFAWSYESDDDIMYVQFSDPIFAGQTAFRFKVFENQRNRQVWQAEERFGVWNSLSRDSSEQRILVRWQLVREEE
ncbi:MAG: hypothetical protein AAF399_13865 [Bacteroidota bacterium]